MDEAPQTEIVLYRTEDGRSHIQCGSRTRAPRATIRNFLIVRTRGNRRATIRNFRMVRTRGSRWACERTVIRTRRQLVRTAYRFATKDATP